MTTEHSEKVVALRLDQKVIKMAQASAESLLRVYPELGSIAIVLGWELPGNAASEFPAGVWARNDGPMTFDRIIGMQHQLSRMQTTAVNALAQLCNAAVKATEQNKKIDSGSSEG